MSKLLVAAAALLIAGPAFADEPIRVSPNAVNGSPATTFRRSGGVDSWHMTWLWDDQKRLLGLTVIKAMRPASAEYLSGITESMHDSLFEEGRAEETKWDTRRDGDGSLEIWGGDADWILGSEFAGRVLSFPEMEGQIPGQVVAIPRESERTYCVSFTWMSDTKRRVVAGSYCKVFPVGEIPNAEEMLAALELQFN